jgi:outer membrane lipoprotein SlyB
MMRWTRLLPLAAVVAAVAGCAAVPEPRVYGPEATMQKLAVHFGTVIVVREVTLEGTNSGAGAAVGTGLGGVGGSSIGAGRGPIAGAIVGAGLGQLAGTQAERQLSRRTGWEITYREDDSGQLFVVVQAKDEQVFKPGDRIRILEGSGSVRVFKM